MGKSRFLDDILHEFDLMTNRLIKDVVKEEKKTHNSPLKSIKQHTDEIKSAIEERMEQFKSSFSNGYKLIVANGNILSKQTGVPLEKFLVQSTHTSDKSPLEHSTHTMMKEVVKGKRPLQVTLGYTGEMMAAVYQLAVNYYEGKEYVKCIDLMQFLITLNYLVSWFWQLMGRAYRENGDNEAALFAFKLEIACQSDNIEGYQDAVKCCIATKQYHEAIEILDKGISLNESESLISALNAMKAYVKSLV